MYPPTPSNARESRTSSSLSWALPSAQPSRSPPRLWPTHRSCWKPRSPWPLPRRRRKSRREDCSATTRGWSDIMFIVPSSTATATYRTDTVFAVDSMAGVCPSSPTATTAGTGDHLSISLNSILVLRVSTTRWRVPLSENKRRKITYLLDIFCVNSMLSIGSFFKILTWWGQTAQSSAAARRKRGGGCWLVYITRGSHGGSHRAVFRLCCRIAFGLFVELIEDWEDDLPNLRHIFRPAEIELLLVDAVDCFRNVIRDPGRTFVDFVARSGYVDEPGKVECRRGIRPSLGRVTPLHRLFELHWDDEREDWVPGGLDGLCFKLLKIYDRYDVDYVEEATGVTHFHVACCCLFASDDDHLRIIKRFLELGQKPNHVVRETGYSPLHLALQRYNGEAVLLLLRAGADPNSATREKEDTPLHIMSRKGVPGAAVAETFFRACDELNRLVRIDARNRWNRTPLVEALFDHNEEVAALLLRRGADPNSVDDEFLDTPLHLCARGHHDEPTEILFKLCDEMNLPLRVNARDNKGKTPLEFAIANLLPDTVDVLLDHGADLSKGLFSTAIDPKMIRSYLSVMHVASGVLTVAERLEAKGYDFSRNDALTIMKCCAEFGLLKKSAVVKKKFYNNEKFTRQAKEVIVNSSLSLYDLVQLRPEEEEKLLTYQDYFRLASSRQLWKISTKFRDACVLHVCQKMSRGFFRRWALDPFYELIHKKLPTECCEVILEKLSNRDLFNICLAAAGPSTS
ncbi:unnamed protein product [Trichogramma brassicae]|uniref:PRANC domain-containing protein n=1 Tax=Trichogramma brassicae TaxID=86971 RepID=A0A6H5IHP3_9HYME|nr:unnamed protein product [Trichogramma brassicae]